MSNEAVVLAEVKRILKKYSCYGLRTAGSAIGTPDVVACIGGVFFGIEVKDDIDGSYSLTNAQKIKLQEIVNAGGAAAVVDKHNIEEFERYVARLTSPWNDRVIAEPYFGVERSDVWDIQ